MPNRVTREKLATIAYRLGLRLATTSFRRDGALRHRIVRVALNWKQDGRAMTRPPERQPTAGRFMAAA